MDEILQYFTGPMPVLTPSHQRSGPSYNDRTTGRQMSARCRTDDDKMLRSDQTDGVVSSGTSCVLGCGRASVLSIISSCCSMLSRFGAMSTAVSEQSSRSPICSRVYVHHIHI